MGDITVLGNFCDLFYEPYVNGNFDTLCLMLAMTI